MHTWLCKLMSLSLETYSMTSPQFFPPPFTQNYANLPHQTNIAFHNPKPPNKMNNMQIYCQTMSAWSTDQTNENDNQDNSDESARFESNDWNSSSYILRSKNNRKHISQILCSLSFCLLNFILRLQMRNRKKITLETLTQSSWKTVPVSSSNITALLRRLLPSYNDKYNR